MSIEDKLQQLREEWRRRPDKRKIIEMQAKLLKQAAARLKPDPPFEATVKFAQDLFAGRMGIVSVDQEATQSNLASNLS